MNLVQHSSSSSPSRSIRASLLSILGYGQGKEERPKPVIQLSRWRALTRCKVHLIPISVSAFIIWLNMYNMYLGRTLPGAILEPSTNIALLQVAAKAQELMIIASLTAIVLEVIRHELTSGKGLPLGILGSCFNFTSLGFFLSPAFVGSFHAKWSMSTKSRVMAVLIVGMLMASVAGPSAAVLLIPREQTWNAGGTNIFLPGSKDVWWPDEMNGSSSDLKNLCSTSIFSSRGICPQNGYRPLSQSKNSLDIYGQGAFVEGMGNKLTKDFVFGPVGIDVYNDFDRLKGLRYSGSARGYACETAMVGVRAVEGIYNKQILQDWVDAVNSLPFNAIKPSLSAYKYHGSISATVSSRVPVVRVACSPAMDILKEQNQITLPVFSNHGCTRGLQETATVFVDGLNKTQSDSIRIQWIDASNSIGTASSALALELPWNQGNSSRAVIGCSIDARWAKGTVITSDLRSFSTSSNLDPNFQAPDAIGPVVQQLDTGIGGPKYSEFRPVLSDSTASPIRLRPNWLYNTNSASLPETGFVGWNEDRLLDFLNSTGMMANTRNDSTAAAWNSNTPGVVNSTVALEWLIAVVTTDALSRVGSESLLDPTNLTVKGYDRLPDFADKIIMRGRSRDTAVARPSSTFSEEIVKLTVGGYSYQAVAVTDYLAIAVLSVHIVLALLHSAFLISRGKTFSAWNSLTELLVLMQNSRPAHVALRNAHVGIGEMKTYSKIARLCVTPNAHAPEDMENVELVFDEPAVAGEAEAELQVIAMYADKRDLQHARIIRPASSVYEEDALTSAKPLEVDNASLTNRRGIQPGVCYGHGHA